MLIGELPTTCQFVWWTESALLVNAQCPKQHANAANVGAGRVATTTNKVIDTVCSRRH